MASDARYVRVVKLDGTVHEVLVHNSLPAMAAMHLLDANNPAAAAHASVNAGLPTIGDKEKAAVSMPVAARKPIGDEKPTAAAEEEKKAAEATATAAVAADPEEEKRKRKAAVIEAVHALLHTTHGLAAEMRSSKAAAAECGAAQTGPKVVVFTGGPGVGKTTLIDALQSRLGCPVVPEAAFKAIDVLNEVAGKPGQLAWRKANASAFGDLVGRIALRQEAEAAANAEAKVVLFDRTVLDNLGYSLQRGYAVPDYLTAEVAATATNRIGHVLILDQVASVEEIEKRNRETGRKTDQKASVAMSAALEEVYTKLGCDTRRVAAGTVEERVAAVISMCGLEEAA